MTTHVEESVDQKQKDWKVEDSVALYMIDRWGTGYFGVNGNGDITVAPVQDNGIAVPIIDVLRAAQAMNLGAPLLIRFQDLLRHRVQMINGAFNRAIAEHTYKGVYRGVFPLKVKRPRGLPVSGCQWSRYRKFMK